MYKSIADYGIIGDIHSVALISEEASSDYCSMPFIHSPTVFAAILDDEKGGKFRIYPNSQYHHQEYLVDTNILSTEFKIPTGTAQLIDFMPIQSNKFFQKVHLICRSLEMLSGNADFVLELSPRPQYAQMIPKIFRKGSSFQFSTGLETFTLFFDLKQWRVNGYDNDNLVIFFSLNEGEKANFSFVYVQGKNKKNSKLPVSSVRQNKGNLYFYLDRPIASLLNINEKTIRD